MAATKWTLFYPGDSSSKTFQNNPDDRKGSVGSVAFDKNLHEAQVGQNGPIMVFTQDKALQSEFTLTVYSQAEYQAMWSWYYKGDILTLTDDLGRAFSIFITEIDAKRIRNATQPWKHELSFHYLVTSMTDI